MKSSKILLLLIIPFFLVPGITRGENQGPDSLMGLLKNARDDTLKMQTYFDLCLYYRYKNPDSAIYYGKMGKQLAEKINDQVGLAKNCNCLGIAHDIHGQYPEAIEYYFKALRVNEKIGNKEEIGKILNNIGIVYDYQQKNDKALEYYDKSLAVKKELGNKRGQAYTHLNIGLIYANKDVYDTALVNYHNSLQLFDLEKDKNAIAAANINLGVVYSKKGELEKAITYFKKGMQLKKEMGNKHGVTICMKNIGAALLALGKNREGIEKLKQSIELAREIGSKFVLRQAYMTLYEYYNGQENYKKALENYILMAQVEDSMYSEKAREKIAELETRYQTEKKEKEIALLTREKKIQDLEVKKAKSTRTWLLIIAFLVLILAIITYQRYRIKNRLSKKLQESEIHLKKINATKDKFFSILAHDLKSPMLAFRSISSSLSENIELLEKNQIAYYARELNQASGKLVDLLNNLLQWALTQTKRLDYSPREIDFKEIAREAMALFSASRTEKNIAIECPGLEPLKAIADRDMIFTVIRNLLSNAMKFSPPGSTIQVSCKKQGEDILFSITDEGPGLSPGDQEKLFRVDVKNKDIGTPDNKGTGLGLILCKEFIGQHGGQIGVESEEGKGSTFWFRLPASQEQEQATSKQ